MTRYEHLPVYKSVYDFELYYYRLCRGLPKDVKYEIAAEVKGHISHLLEAIIRANNSIDKINHLQEALILLELVKFKIRMMREIGSLKIKSYEFISRSIFDISRQIQSWLLWAEKGRGQNC